MPASDDPRDPIEKLAEFLAEETHVLFPGIFVDVEVQDERDVGAEWDSLLGAQTPVLVLRDEDEVALGDFVSGGEGVEKHALHAFVELLSKFLGDLLDGSWRGTVADGQPLVSCLDFLLKLTEELVVDYASELERKLGEAFPRGVVGRRYV